MAERMGFEPMKELPLYTLSKRTPSTTRVISVEYPYPFFLVFLDLNLAPTRRRQYSYYNLSSKILNCRYLGYFFLS